VLRARLATFVGILGTLSLFGGAACSLLTELDGLSGAPAAAGTDGGSPVPDGAGAVDDGGTVTKDGAAADGATGPDGAVTNTSFCTGSTHAFCADFEDDDPLAAWTQKVIDVGTTGAVSTTRAKSGSHSFFAMIPQRAASTPDVNVLLDKRFPGSWRRVVVELDIFEEPPAWSSGDINAALISVETQSSSNGQAWFLTTGPNYTNLNSVSRPAMATGQWVHVKLDFDPTGTINGTVGAISYAAGVVSQTSGANPSMLVRVGLNGFNSPVPKFAVYYDNVTIDLP
jgi:hypothetical protein